MGNGVNTHDNAITTVFMCAMCNGWIHKSEDITVNFQS